MNVTEQSKLSSYASGEILSARRKADNGRPKGDVIGKRSFPKRGTSAEKKKTTKCGDLLGIENWTEIAFVPCLFLYC